MKKIFYFEDGTEIKFFEDIDFEKHIATVDMANKVDWTQLADNAKAHIIVKVGEPVIFIDAAEVEL